MPNDRQTEELVLTEIQCMESVIELMDKDEDETGDSVPPVLFCVLSVCLCPCFPRPRNQRLFLERKSGVPEDCVTDVCTR